MLSDVPGWMLQLMATFGGAVGAYVAIRADLAALKAQMTIYEKSLDRAHARIDAIHKG